MCEANFEKLPTCLICDYRIGGGSSYDIFYTYVQQSGNSLAKCIEKIIRTNLRTLTLQTNVLCGKCFTLFDELDHAEQKTEEIQRFVFTCFRQNSEKYEYGADLPDSVHQTKSVACQTEIELLTCDSVMHLQSKKPELLQLSSETPNKHYDDEEERAVLSIPGSESVEAINTVYNYDDCLLPVKTDSGIVLHETQGDSKYLFEQDKGAGDESNKLQVIACDDEKAGDVKKGKHSCNVCGKVCRRPCELNQHMISHSGAKPYECEKCGKFFSTKGGAEVHVVKQHAELGNIIFHNPPVKVEKALALSEKGNEDKNPSVDADDDFEWKLESGNLFEDRKIDENVCSEEAERIELESVQSTKAKRGIEKSPKPRSKRQSKSGQHKCEMCSKMCRTPGELRMHVTTHSAEKPFICEICGQGYKHKYALETHVAIHKGENRFRCTFCNKVFTQKGGLQRHLPMHTGEKPYQCDLCGKTFVHHTSFRVHKLVHSGEKSYKCDRCGLALLSASHLKRHMRIHTGEKRFECQTCLKKFAERYNLYAHMRTHSGVKAYKCNACDASFDRKSKCDEHMATHKWISQEFQYQTPVTESSSSCSSSNIQALCLPQSSSDVVQLEIHMNNSNQTETQFLIVGKSHDHQEERKFISTLAASNALSIDGRLMVDMTSRQCLNNLLTTETVPAHIQLYPDTSSLGS